MSIRLRIALNWLCVAINGFFWGFRPAGWPWTLSGSAALLIAIHLRKPLGDPAKRAPAVLRPLIPACVGAFVAILFVALLNAYSVGTGWLMPVLLTVFAVLAVPCVAWGIYEDYRLFTGRVSWTGSPSTPSDRAPRR